MRASTKRNYRALRGSGQGDSLGLGFFYAQVIRAIKTWARRMKPKSLSPCLGLPACLRGGQWGEFGLTAWAPSSFSWSSREELNGMEDSYGWVS